MGYMGKYIEVDLSQDSIRVNDLDFKAARNYIGGKGLGAKILYDNVPSGTDPLSPDNIVLFMTGPLTGSRVQTSGRWCIVTKSPQTGIFTDSHIGGKFGHRLKRAGFDYVMVRGKASSPSYIDVSDEEVVIRSAEDLWGLGTFETERVLQQRHEKVEVTSIGPAGENLVSFACAVTDQTHVAGRGGVGAVMGSKNLKAIVARGSRQIKESDSERFSNLTRTLTKEVLANPNIETRHELGTPLWVSIANDAGFLPTRNYQSGVFEGADSISGERMRDEFVVGHEACYGCAIACGKRTRFEQGKYAPLEVEGPEYETIGLLGSNCGVDDLASIAKSSQMCDDLGIDTISAGGTIAFAMEATEHGVLDQEDVEDLSFGNSEAVHELIRLISAREGVGDLLARGSLKVAEEIGQGSAAYAI
jgi:aldehyde:ferredoxin oxidoreductase